MRPSSQRVAWLVGAAIACASFVAACGSSQKPAPSAEQVRDGEALPPAPPVPAQPADTNSPTAPTVPAEAVAATPNKDAEPAKATLSDGQLARLTELVNKAEIEQAKLAQSRSKSPAVKKFAAMMIKHHGDALGAQERLVKKLNVTPADSEVAGTLKADSEKTLDTLKKSDAAGFDKAYAQSQIDGHQKVLDLLDKHAPSAATPEVADLLRKARDYVEQHLREAQALPTK